MVGSKSRIEVAGVSHDRLLELEAGDRLHGPSRPFRRPVRRFSKASCQVKRTAIGTKDLPALGHVAFRLDHVFFCSHTLRFRAASHYEREPGICGCPMKECLCPNVTSFSPRSTGFQVSPLGMRLCSQYSYQR